MAAYTYVVHEIAVRPREMDVVATATVRDGSDWRIVETSISIGTGSIWDLRRVRFLGRIDTWTTHDRFGASLLHAMPNKFGRISSLGKLVSDGVGFPPESIPSLTVLFVLRNKAPLIVPPTVCEMGNLRELYLNSCKMRTLPTEMNQLTSLRKLSLDTNHFTEIPGCIGDLGDSLEDLDMGNNRLPTLPNFLWGMVNLRALDVRNNRLSGRLSTKAGQLVSLRKLGLGWNTNLCSIPASLYNARDLAMVSLQGTGITILPGPFRLLPFFVTSPWMDTYESLYWHPRYHMRFPDEFKRMVLAFCMCNFRFVLPYLPTEMLWAIFECLEFN
jgi:hypothetical protein